MEKKNRSFNKISRNNHMPAVSGPETTSNSGMSSVVGVGGGLLFPLVSKNNGGYSNGQEENTKTNQPKSVQPSTNTGLENQHNQSNHPQALFRLLKSRLPKLKTNQEDQHLPVSSR